MGSIVHYSLSNHGGLNNPYHLLLPDEEDELVACDGHAPEQLQVGEAVPRHRAGDGRLHRRVVRRAFLGEGRKYFETKEKYFGLTFMAGDIWSVCRERIM